MTEFITRNYGNENFEIIIKTDSKEHYKATQDFARGLIDHTKPAPTIEAKPVVHAHWDNVNGGRIICTHCGNYPLYDYFGRLKLSNICPSCGAQMDESISCSHENDNNTQKVSIDDHIAEGGKKEPFPQAHENGVKIPVISMEDVPKLAKEMEK